MPTIRYNETYEIITDESAEHGEAADSGLVSEDCESICGMIDLLRGTQPSCWPLPTAEQLRLPGYRVWFTQYGERDYVTGETENRSYHPVTDRDNRYMVTAWKIAN